MARRRAGGRLGRGGCARGRAGRRRACRGGRRGGAAGRHGRTRRAVAASGSQVATSRNALRVFEVTVGHCSELSRRGTAQHDQPGSGGAAQARSRHRGQERLSTIEEVADASSSIDWHASARHHTARRRCVCRRRRRKGRPQEADPGQEGGAQEPAEPAAPTLGPPRLVKAAKAIHQAERAPPATAGDHEAVAEDESSPFRRAPRKSRSTTRGWKRGPSRR